MIDAPTLDGWEKINGYYARFTQQGFRIKITPSDEGFMVSSVKSNAPATSLRDAVDLANGAANAAWGGWK